MIHMRNAFVRRFITVSVVFVAVTVLWSCSGNGESGEESAIKVTLALDWTPNTNHTGAYVARDMGYFAEEGLDVEIIQPSEIGADAMTAMGAVDFAFSYQESVTFARTAETPVPIKAIAAVIQHNTSGFASLAEKGIKTPADFAGKTYGGWGSDVERATLKALMEKEGARADSVTIVNTGSVDFFQSSLRDIDFAWIFWGWTGVEAEVRGVALNYVRLIDFAPELDYYTPVLITSESVLADKPELVRAFLRGIAKGYRYSIENPEEAAEVLIKAVPEINSELVRRSQKWLADQYQAEAPRWGEMKISVWQDYAAWLKSHGLIQHELDAGEAYTNEFLP